MYATSVTLNYNVTNRHSHDTCTRIHVSTCNLILISDTIQSTLVQNPRRTAIAVVNLAAVASAAIAPVVLCMLQDLEHNHKIKNVVLE